MEPPSSNSISSTPPPRDRCLVNPSVNVETSDSNTTPVPTPTPSPVPPPVPVETHPNRALKGPLRAISDPSRLAPEDAFKTFSPPRLRPLTEIAGSAAASAAAAALRPAVASLRAPPAIPPVAARLAEERRRNASRKRRQPHVWKKLLWIKQHGYPDNYTDTDTFLDHLQLNPRLRPYDFWPLVADSTVIVQHVCSVAIFVCAYAGIYQDRMSPVTVVACGTLATVAGWILWDYWMGLEEEAELRALRAAKRVSADIDDGSSTSSGGSALPISTNGYVNGHADGHLNGHVTGKQDHRVMGLTLSTANLSAKNLDSNGASKHGQSLSKSSFQSISPIDSLTEGGAEPFPILHATHSIPSPSPTFPNSAMTLPLSVSPRNQVRLKTFKSALLIYFALLGLSPILKSLTKSTSSDSIWALATWLLIINIFFFDYGTTKPRSKSARARSTSQTVISSGPSMATPVDPSLTPPNISSRSPPFPSSLSTNAALMASTVLASRLLTTTAVFSLTLFSIQVFGLFPVFRRHLRSVSLSLHVILTTGLIVLATSSLGLILSQSYTHTYGDCGYCLSWLWHVVSRSVMGVMVFGGCTVFVMGACSWWLIGLQRYKSVVIGPWDAAKPVLAGGGYVRRGTGTD
jgi:phosphatidylinositol N-acetylglucosaminyltransferase subunit C